MRNTWSVHTSPLTAYGSGFIRTKVSQRCCHHPSELPQLLRKHWLHAQAEMWKTRTVNFFSWCLQSIKEQDRYRKQMWTARSRVTERTLCCHRRPWTSRKFSWQVLSKRRGDNLLRQSYGKAPKLWPTKEGTRISVPLQWSHSCETISARNQTCSNMLCENLWSANIWHANVFDM